MYIYTPQHCNTEPRRLYISRPPTTIWTVPNPISLSITRVSLHSLACPPFSVLSFLLYPSSFSIDSSSLYSSIPTLSSFIPNLIFLSSVPSPPSILCPLTRTPSPSLPSRWGVFNINFKDNKWAFIYCGVSTFGALCYGYDQIYYTGLLGMKPFIEEYGQTDSSGARALTTSFTSLTASIIYVGELLGALLAAPINARWGRKTVFYTAALCIIAGAIVQLASHGLEGLIVLGRILIGLGIGQYTVTCLLYIGEVAPLAVRGPALMMFQLMQSCSQLVGSGITQGTESIDNKNAYLIPMGLLFLLPGLMVICLPWTPESPVWYALKGRMAPAEKSLRKINRSNATYDPAGDMQTLNDAVERKRAAEAESSWAALFRSPIERRKLIYACGSMVAQQINGIQFFYSYGVIFAQSIGTSQPFTISLITNVLQVVAVAVSVVLGNKVRRRPNLMACSIIMFLTFLIIGGLGTLRAPFSTGVATAIVVFSYIVIVAFNFSMGPLAYTVASEAAVGPNRNKIMSCAIVTLGFFFTVWVIAFTSPYLFYSANLGPMICFIYAGTTLITIAYMWLCVGETTGRTTYEVERFYAEGIPVRQWRHHVFLLTAAPAILEAVEQETTAIVPALTVEAAKAAPDAVLPPLLFNGNEAAFRWAFNSDACAVEKSDDAMRRFYADTEKLKQLLATKL